MAEPISLPKGYKRLGAFAIDEDSVFTTQVALDAYLAGGSSYAGQVVALVLDGENEAQIYKVNKDKSLGSIGSVDITVDAEPTENSENPVSSGGVFIALSNKAESDHTHEIDAAPTQDSTKPVSSGGVFTELGKKAESNHNHTLSGITPDANNANKVPVVSADGTVIGYTAFTVDQIVQLASIDLSDIAVGEKKIVLAEKAEDGSPIMGGAITQLDKLGPPTLSTILAETQAGWDGDEITVTGNNLNGALGENSQEYRIGSDFFLCIAHSYGTDATNGSATWVRNRGQDSLTPGVANDDAIITELETEDGWSAANFKQIGTKSKKGTWYRNITGGYLYMCIDKLNGWTRVGSPLAIDLEITDTTHPILIASLKAHSWSSFYLEGTNETDEAAEQGQEYWDNTLGFVYKRGKDGYWMRSSVADRENIFFAAIAPDYGIVTRGFNFKVIAKSDFGGTSTITTSADVAYNIGDTVNSGDYLKVSSDTELSRTVLIIQPV
nr:hypothetical protein [uncultured Carboxylicivirga sp.]